MEFAKTAFIRQLRNIRTVSEVKRVHSSILESPCRNDGFVANLLVLAYGRCGNVVDAKSVFDGEIPQKNIYSWNLMLQAFAENGHYEDTIVTFKRMPRKDIISLTVGMTAYGVQGDLEQAWNLFLDMNGRNVICWNAMLSAYTQWCHFEEATALFFKMPETGIIAWTLVIQANALAGNMDEVRMMFDNAPQRDVVLCTAVIQGYSQNGQVLESKCTFDKMPQHNAISCSIMSQAYAESGFLDEAKEIFDYIRWEKSLFSWTSLIQSYAFNNRLDKAVKMFYLLPRHDTVSCTTMVQTMILSSQMIPEAQDLFNTMPVRNHITWNTLLWAYSHVGHVTAAESVIARAPQANATTWTAMVSVYAVAGRLQDAEAIFHGLMVERSFYTWNIMLQGYSNHKGYLQKAKDIFSKMPQRDLVSWNSMGLGYAHNGLFKESANIYGNMPETDSESWNSILAAHSSRGVPVQVMKKFFDEDMKSWRNKQSCNIMLAAYAQNGEALAAIDLVHKMVLEGFKPDEITLSSILTCCSYIGLVDTGRSYFLWITAEFGLKPRPEDFTCMINLLTKAGRLGDALDLLRNMPFFPDVFGWTTLLAASMEHADTENVNEVAKCALEVNKSEGAPYVLLSNSSRPC